MAVQQRHSRQPRVKRASTTFAKAPTGIPGLDEAMQGGLPRGRTTVVFGGPGSGKTIFGLQSLVTGARRWKEAGIFVAFEENSKQILANVESFGWKVPELQGRSLFFVDAKLNPGTTTAGKFDLTGLLSGLAEMVRLHGAQRVVFDGISVLLAMLDDPAAEMNELYRIHEWLREHRLTGIITAKAIGPDPFEQPRYGFVAYMADCALLFARRHQQEVSERSVSILKYRGSAFSENRLPLLIGPAGIEVADHNAMTDALRAPNDRVSTGVPALDAMLSGGYYRSSATLLTGLPGTAKSSLSGAFLQAACRRGERVLYVGFDERAEEIVRNLTAIGIRLLPFIQSGHLKMLSALSLADSAEVQLMRIRSAIREHGATSVAIDPISAFAKSSSATMAIGVLTRFIHWAKLHRITLVMTSLVVGSDPHDQAADLGVSTLSDTWIHLSYAQRGGERNRALTIIKSRGTGHSSQVRELILSRRGISLAEVYEVGGEVFMGTMRWEQENLQRDEALRVQAEFQRKRLELERTQAELKARSDLLLRQLALNQTEIEEMKFAGAEHAAQEDHRQRDLMRHRGVKAVVKDARQSRSSSKHKPRAARKGIPS